MRSIGTRLALAVVICTAALTLTSCASTHSRNTAYTAAQEPRLPSNYAARLPSSINTKANVWS